MHLLIRMQGTQDSTRSVYYTHSVPRFKFSGDKNLIAQGIGRKSLCPLWPPGPVGVALGCGGKKRHLVREVASSYEAQDPSIPKGSLQLLEPGVVPPSGVPFLFRAFRPEG